MGYPLLIDYAGDRLSVIITW